MNLTKKIFKVCFLLYIMKKIIFLIVGFILVILILFSISSLISFPKGKVIINNFNWIAGDMFISSNSKMAIIETRAATSMDSKQSLFDLNTGEKILDIPTDQIQFSTFSPDLTKIIYVIPNKKFSNEYGYTRYKEIYQIIINTKKVSLLSSEEYSLYHDEGWGAMGVPPTEVFGWFNNKFIYTCRNPLTKDESTRPEFGYCELDINSGVINNLGKNYSIDTEKYDINNLWSNGGSSDTKTYMKNEKYSVNGRTIEKIRTDIGASEGFGAFGKIYSVKIDGKLKYRGIGKVGSSEENPSGRIFVAPNGDVYILFEDNLRKIS